MGKLTDKLKKKLGNLIKNKGAMQPLLLEAHTSVTNSEEDFQKKQKSFKDTIKVPESDNTNIGDKKVEENTPIYNPMYMISGNNRWYVDEKLREDYYYNNSGDKYSGAITPYPTKECVIFKCKYQDTNGQGYEIELGKMERKKVRDIERIIENGNALNYITEHIDNIIALQIEDKKTGEQSIDKIQEDYESLKRTGFQFTLLGEKILLHDDKENLQLPDFKPQAEYPIIFSELETKEVVSSIPVITTQAVVKKGEEKAEVEKFIQLCKLAIDIGCFDVQDWKKIDERNYSFRRLGEKRYNEPGSVFYSRKATGKMESYNILAQSCFNSQSELDQITRKSLLEKRETMHYYYDEKENVIRKRALQKVVEYAELLESCIDMYKADNPSEVKNINLLNDMICFAKGSQLKDRAHTSINQQKKIDEIPDTREVG